MCEQTDRLVTIPVVVLENVVEVTYRFNAIRILPVDKRANSYGEIVELFCEFVQDWNLTEVLQTRFRGRIVETKRKVPITRTRLLGASAVPGFLLMHILVAVIADWAATVASIGICAECAEGGAKVTAEEEVDG